MSQLDQVIAHHEVVRQGMPIRCVYCKKHLERHQMTVDHRLPRLRGGGNAMINLVIACQPCNNAKGPLTFSEYMAVRADGKRRKALITKVLAEHSKKPMTT